MRMTITAIATGLAVLLTQPAIAGGPILVEDTTETVAPDRERKIGGILIVLAGFALVAAMASDKGGCFAEEVTPGPTPDPVGC